MIYYKKMLYNQTIPAPATCMVRGYFFGKMQEKCEKAKGEPESRKYRGSGTNHQRQNQIIKIAESRPTAYR